jgi:protein-disulfide isomerase
VTRSTQIFGLVGVVAFVLAGALIAVSLTGGKSSSPKTAAAGEPLNSVGDVLSIYDGIPEHGIALGNPKAPVTVVEYADLQCPYCAKFAVDELPTFVRKYVRTGKARIEFRGMDFVGPDSVKGLRTALAASQQNKLWPFIDLLYANQGTENAGWLNDDIMRRAGREIPGLDVEKMFAARDGASVTALVQAAAGSAATAGVNSTPTLFAGRTGGTLTRVGTASAAALAAAVDSAS